MHKRTELLLQRARLAGAVSTGMLADFGPLDAETGVYVMTSEGEVAAFFNDPGTAMLFALELANEGRAVEMSHPESGVVAVEPTNSPEDRAAFMLREREAAAREGDSAASARPSALADMAEAVASAAGEGDTASAAPPPPAPTMGASFKGPELVVDPDAFADFTDDFGSGDRWPFLPIFAAGAEACGPNPNNEAAPRAADHHRVEWTTDEATRDGCRQWFADFADIRKAMDFAAAVVKRPGVRNGVELMGPQALDPQFLDALKTHKARPESRLDIADRLAFAMLVALWMPYAIFGMDRVPTFVLAIAVALMAALIGLAAAGRRWFSAIVWTLALAWLGGHIAVHLLVGA